MNTICHILKAWTFRETRVPIITGHGHCTGFTSITLSFQATKRSHNGRNLANLKLSDRDTGGKDDAFHRCPNSFFLFWNSSNLPRRTPDLFNQKFAEWSFADCARGKGKHKQLDRVPRKKAVVDRFDNLTTCLIPIGNQFEKDARLGLSTPHLHTTLHTRTPSPKYWRTK